jgi:hypothetical protein
MFVRHFSAKANGSGFVILATHNTCLAKSSLLGEAWSGQPFCSSSSAHYLDSALKRDCASSDSLGCRHGHYFLVIMPRQMTQDWLAAKTNLLQRCALPCA